MCNPVLLIAGAAASGYAMHKQQKKKEDKAKAAHLASLDKINQQYQNLIEQNKIANSMQSTDPVQEATTAEKLKQQKLPLNTTNTGATVGTPTSVGLNLGGY